MKKALVFTLVALSAALALGQAAPPVKTTLVKGARLLDVRTGQCAFPARGAAIAAYAVRVDGNDVFVDVP